MVASSSALPPDHVSMSPTQTWSCNIIKRCASNPGLIMITVKSGLLAFKSIIENPLVNDVVHHAIASN